MSRTSGIGTTRRGFIAAGFVAAAGAVLDSCAPRPERVARTRTRSPGRTGPTTSVGTPRASLEPPRVGSKRTLILAVDFSGTICSCIDTYTPEPGCDLCYQSVCKVGAFGARTGPRCLSIDRFGVNHRHQGVVKAYPPEQWSHSEIWTGVSHRIPKLRWDGRPAPPFIEIHQATSGQYSWPTEVVLLPDRHVGLQVFHFDNHPIVGEFTAPEDGWFSTVLHAVSGNPSTQTLYIYDDRENLVEKLTGEWDTRTDPAHPDVRHKVGGDYSLGTGLNQNVTFHDDWWIATENLGPFRVTRELDRFPRRSA